MLIEFTIISNEYMREEETWILPVIGWSKADGYRLPKDSFEGLLPTETDYVHDIDHVFIYNDYLMISWDGGAASDGFKLKNVRVVDRYPDYQSPE